MLSFFKSNPLKKSLKEAGEWLQLGRKVYAYRRDVLPVPGREALRSSIDKLDAVVTNAKKAGSKDTSESDIKDAIQDLEKILRTTGGSFYPRNFFAENIDMLLVAAILALGVRAYFFQPFKIPTNSMYPTYNGMTYKLYHTPESKPDRLTQLLRFPIFGGSLYSIEAPVDGRLIIPYDMPNPNGGDTFARSRFQARMVKGSKFFIFPTYLAEYTVYIGQRPATIRVPLDFTWDKLIEDLAISSGKAQNRFEQGIGPVLDTGLDFKAGQKAIEFEILSGDALFVDRISYHFIKPKVGAPFVFRTGNIPLINGDQYYIKRLTGLPGDELKIDDYTLYRNGSPITGAEAFDLNANQVGEYEGYINSGALSEGLIVRVPEHHYYALGDNSDESLDSRAWGFVPEKEVIGRAIFIYWPFTSHWGPSK